MIIGRITPKKRLFLRKIQREPIVGYVLTCRLCGKPAVEVSMKDGDYFYAVHVDGDDTGCKFKRLYAGDAIETDLLTAK